MKKRILALALTLVMVLALLPTSALAAALTIPCQYEEASDFSDDLALVRDDAGNRYYIDRNGTPLLACPYPTASSFSDSYAAVCDESGKWGYIDKTGTLVIPCQYGEARDFHEGMAAVRDDDWNWGFINKAGAVVVPLQYDDVGDFSGGLAAVVDEDWMLGFIDKAGKMVIPAKFYYTMSTHGFKNGIAPVATGENSGSYGGGEGGPTLDAYIDTTGTIVARMGGPGYDTLEEQYWQRNAGGYQTCQDETTYQYGLEDAAGNLVIPYSYDYVGGYFDPEEGMVMVEKDNKYGYVDLTAPTPANIAYPSTQMVELDGQPVEFPCYALKDAAGNDTNYIKLRDLANLLNGTAGQFQVGWDGSVAITTGQSYTPDGSEGSTPFSGQRPYEPATAATVVNGQAVQLNAFVLKDDAGGGYTYYKLRDLGAVLGITVDWTPECGVYIETK